MARSHRWSDGIVGKVASADLFPVLGVQPALGRAYGPSEDEEGRDDVIIVSDEFWRTRLGGRPDVIGTTISTNGRSRTLIGVMPAGFTLLGERTDFLVPYGWTIEGLRAARGRGYSFGIARLREGVSFEQASLDMKGIAAQLGKEAPQRNTGWSITLVPVHEQMVDQIRPALQVLAGAALFVLLVSCVNVANLLFARSTSREREMVYAPSLAPGVAASFGNCSSRVCHLLPLAASLVLPSRFCFIEDSLHWSRTSYRFPG